MQQLPKHSLQKVVQASVSATCLGIFSPTVHAPPSDLLLLRVQVFVLLQMTPSPACPTPQSNLVRACSVHPRFLPQTMLDWLVTLLISMLQVSHPLWCNLDSCCLEACATQCVGDLRMHMYRASIILLLIMTSQPESKRTKAVAASS